MTTDLPLVSCLLPTFGKFPRNAWMVEEAIECFLRQDYKRKELLLCNDCPIQSLVLYDTPQVRVINCSERFPTLGEKLQWMIDKAQGEYICRWDDDDLSMPWRLSLSVAALRQTGAKEWRAENHWYDANGHELKESRHPGNTHIMSIWQRGILGTTYPGNLCPSGFEDQTFNAKLWSLGYPRFGTMLPLDKIFYFYRWGYGAQHLSGRGGGEKMQESYGLLAKGVAAGTYTLCPRWRADYVQRHTAAVARLSLAATPAPSPALAPSGGES